MRYKIVKMTKEQINKYHSCDLCECSQGAFCLYPGECTNLSKKFTNKNIFFIFEKKFYEDYKRL